ncbi:MAG: 2-oxo-4-hydroxy-4-carboxy-5-ureidoimidazoline decarboxylase [Sandaracinaceae bacterium]
MSALDAMDEDEARAALTRCCGASRWVEGMLRERPLGDALFDKAREVWATMGRDDVLEAFTHHPRIGADLAKLREKFAATEAWSAGEQSGATSADESTLRALRDGNLAYEARFGHIFIVCATGKSAAEMLSLLEARMDNDPDEELAVAAAEQMKITELRLHKLQDEQS